MRSHAFLTGSAAIALKTGDQKEEVCLLEPNLWSRSHGSKTPASRERVVQSVLSLRDLEEDS